MSKPLKGEQRDIYNLFRNAAQEVEVEFDPEGVWFFKRYVEGEEESEENPKDAFEEAVDNIKESYKNGALETSYIGVKVIAAIALCDAAQIHVYDYVGAGGEKY